MILCIVYISTSSSSLLTRVASLQLSKLVHSFSDVTYNRTSFFFVEEIIKSNHLKQSVLQLCEAAYQEIDYRQHQGTHPALGTCDHICFSPLGTTTRIDDVKQVASSLSTDFTKHFDVPVYTYGALSDTKMRLRDIRKNLGYFNSNSIAVNSAATSGSNDNHTISAAAVSAVDPRKGVNCMGVVPFVLNYNIRFTPGTAKEKVIKVTANLRCPEVEALTLMHEEGSYESACNLLHSRVVTPEQVLATATARAAELEIEIIKAYTTGPSETELMNAFYETSSTKNE